MVSSSAAKRPVGRVLAIDYGRRRLGLALSDELGMLAQPLATLECTNRRAVMARLARIVSDKKVQRIVVGLPLRMDGAAGEMAKEARAFAARLGKATGRPVEMIDERLTSWEAARGLAPGKSAAAKQRSALDQRAAVLILEEYLRNGQARN